MLSFSLNIRSSFGYDNIRDDGGLRNVVGVGNNDVGI